MRRPRPHRSHGEHRPPQRSRHGSALWPAPAVGGIVSTVLLLTACAAAGSSAGGAAVGDGTPSSPGTAAPPASTSPTTPSASPPAAGAGGTDLTVVVDDGTGGSVTWRLTCDPAGGDHPDPVAACAALVVNGATALPDVSASAVCTQVYGGPQTARISGTWRGEDVAAALSRRDGCQIARWDALRGLLPAPGA